MGKFPVRLPSYVAAGVLSEHADSENTMVGGTSSSTTHNLIYNTISSGGTVVSASITLTKKCLVVVVSLVVMVVNYQRTDIVRGGVIKTKETIISPANFVTNYPTYAHLQYATEVLDPGTYTYSVVNTAGVTLSFYGAAIKIVAVACS
jgi:hypothetical protein